jgi:hypothetical protein
MNRNTSLLETELYVRHDFSPDTFLKNDALRYDIRRRGLFAEKLLLYDTMVIPTHDLGIIPVLITWIGPHLFEQLLDEGTLRFCRLRSFVAYGRGSGLVMLRIEPPTKEEREKSVFWGPTDKAIELQLMHTVPFIKRNRRTKLIEKVLKQTLEEPLGDFPKIIMKETYDDVLNDIGLQAFFTKRRKKVDLARLPGIKSKEVRILGEKHPRDEIEFLLRLGEINMELALASNLKCLSVTTDPLAQRLIAAKIRRNLNSLAEDQLNDLHRRFCKILELNNLPDIPAIVANDKIDFDEIIKLRYSRKGQQFRHWLANLKIQKPDDVVAMYLEVLTKKHWSQNWPVRTVRFILAASLDVLLAQAGIPLPAASAVDSFILGQFLKGYSPQLFLDELRNLWEEARKRG